MRTTTTTRRWALWTLVWLAGTATTACGTDAEVELPPPDAPAPLDPGGRCALYQVPANLDLMTPTVSFQTQVMPIFHAVCSSAACHGSGDTPAGGVYLGSDSGAVWTGLVGVSSGAMPVMTLVTPGDPTKSFLMHKMDGDQCAFDHACVADSCGQLMPRDGNSPMPVGNRDTVRRWIAQGANDN